VITGTVLGGALSALTMPAEAAGGEAAGQASDRLMETYRRFHRGDGLGGP